MGFNSVHVSSGEFRSEGSAEKMILLMTTLRASVKPKNKEGVRAAAGRCRFGTYETPS